MTGNPMVHSCWKHTKQGVSIVREQKLWQQRLQVLRECINYWIQHRTDKVVETIQLYYDED
jgi:hypothetical protein